MADGHPGNDAGKWEMRCRVVSNLLATLGVVGLVLAALMTIADVLLRWLFSAPIDGLNEITRLMFAVISASFFPAALMERHHISIRFVGGWLGRRAERALDALAGLVTFGVFCLIGWQFVRYTEEMYASGETTWTLGWTVGPWWSVTTLFLIVCIPVQAVVLGSMLVRRRNEADA
jgi:TRAP-type C4-dicarboxylate transport system permease small subunit